MTAMKTTSKEIDELEREIQQSEQKQKRRVRRAVNPQRDFAC
jgi:hypothetical protein